MDGMDEKTKQLMSSMANALLLHGHEKLAVGDEIYSVSEIRDNPETV